MMATLALAAMMLTPCLFSPAPEVRAVRSDPYPDAIKVSGDVANFSGILSPENNSDAYKILLNRTPSNVERVQGFLEKTTPGGEIRIYAYDDLGYWLSWNGTVGSGAVNVSAGAPYTGYVYLVVFLLAGGSSSYRLNITKDNLTSDPLATDDNNSPQQALPAGNGYSTSDRLDELHDAADYYWVDLNVSPPSKDILSVLLTVPAQGDFIVAVYPAGNSSNPFFTDAGDLYDPDFGANETLYYLPAATGRYNVRIWAEHGGGMYDIRFRLFPGYQDSDNEPDNGTELKVDSILKGNVSLHYDDNDYFKMFLPPETTIDLHLSTLDFDGDFTVPVFTLWLLDPGRILVNSSTSSVPEKSAGHLTTQGGWYYIKIAAGRESAGGYILNVTTVRPPELLQPEVEVALDEDNATTVDLATVFRDPQKRPLSFKFTPAEHFNISINGAVMSIAPVHDWNGHAVLTVSAQNAEQKSATAFIDVGVRPMNDAPVPLQSGLSFTSPEGESFELPMSVFALFNDVDGDNLTYSVQDGRNISVTVDENGTVTMTPAQYWWGALLFRMIATDPSNESASVEVALNITPVNNAPLVVSDPGMKAFSENGSVTLDLKRIFWDPDGDTLSYALTGGVDLAATISNGSAVVRTQYSSWPAGWDGHATLNFTATDPSGASAWIEVSFTVTPVNDAPYLWRTLPNQSIREDLAVTLLNLNNYFRDPDNDRLTFGVIGPSFITVIIGPDGNVTFIPAANWSGSESMVFSARDGAGLTASVGFTLTVDAVDDAPQLSLGTISPEKGDASTLFSFTVVCRDIDSPNVTVRLILGRKSLPMERVSGDLQGGALYRVRTTLAEGQTVVYFQADDGDLRTDSSSLDVDVKSSPLDNTLLYMSLGVLIIVVIALALAFSPPRKKRWEEGDEEE
jgi:hypothetical protein